MNMLIFAEYLIKHEKVDGDVFKQLMKGEYTENNETVVEEDTTTSTSEETSTED